MDRIYKIDALPQKMVIGRQTETGVVAVQFDCAAWISHWPQMEISVWATRPGETAAYPVVITRDGNIVTWTVSAVDTAIDGEGSVEIMGVADDKRKLSARVIMRVYASGLGNTQDTPASAKPWVDEVIKAAERAEDAAQKAEDIANGFVPGGGITVETDPTVPEWAKEPQKPTYTADEVGALSAETLPEAVNAALAEAKASGLFDGKPGEDGKDGISPTVSVSKSGKVTTVSITDVNGTKTVTINDGEKGDTGATGETGSQGEKGDTGPAGQDGYTPVKGVDYYTDADKLEMVNAVLAALPAAEGVSY